MPVFHASTTSRNDVTGTRPRSVSPKPYSSQSLAAWSTATATSATIRPSRSGILPRKARRVILSRSGVSRVPFAERPGIARRHIRVVRISAHIRLNLPGPGAFDAPGRAEFDRDPRHIVKAKCRRRPFPRLDGRAGRDGNLGHADLAAVTGKFYRDDEQQLRIGNVDRGRGFQTRTYPLVGARNFQRAGDDAAHAPDVAPYACQRFVAPGSRNLRESVQMHRNRVYAGFGQ